MSDATDSTGTGEGLAELRRSLGGAVLAPTDEGFDAARRVPRLAMRRSSACRR
jgi:hypothetical protein